MTTTAIREVSMLNFEVNDALCTRCRECVKDCPARIIEQQGDAVTRIGADNEQNCMRCQHCLAVCPTGAVSIHGKQPTDSLEISEALLPTLDAVELLMRSRRSVRRFTDQAVDPELISRLLSIAAHAPTGANRRALTFRLIDDREVLNALREKVMEALRTATEAGTVPTHFAYLQTAVPAYFTYGADMIFRGAPHLLIVSAGPDALCPNEDITIALSHFELLVHSAGLGAVWCGMLKMAFECVPDLRSLVGLPPDHAYYAMLFGVPAVRYVRTVQRDDSTPVQRITADSLASV